MSRKSRLAARIDSGLVEVKSKFDAEFRRFSISRVNILAIEKFNDLICEIHNLHKTAFIITYTNPDGDLLPINNNDNFAKALTTAKPLLRLVILHKGRSSYELNGYGTAQHKRNIISRFLDGDSKERPPHKPISLPEDFRCVSAIIDADILPETQRRVKLMKNGSDKPLGFYVRDGISLHVTSQGVEKVPGIFISRLVPGGLAESTGLLAVNDEVLEVNGIEVAGKTLDQVTDMMVANSPNLIITIKPCNQHSGSSQLRDDTDPTLSPSEELTSHNIESINRDDDEDEIQEFTEESVSNPVACLTDATESNNNSVKY